ncbi:hypothetical protein Prum_068270 [Phytohabitans rumicis]|uniref:Uncharacterized protein n=1 Tax=Phytohabitans rumicis TaxID=1076125 RepID=A0A6V8LKL7_9ACTN|nr:hypothetical protein Prum_068270 [Phytohabitans rumicis]
MQGATDQIINVCGHPQLPETVGWLRQPDRPRPGNDLAIRADTHLLPAGAAFAALRPRTPLLVRGRQQRWSPPVASPAASVLGVQQVHGRRGQDESSGQQQPVAGRDPRAQACESYGKHQPPDQRPMSAGWARGRAPPVFGGPAAVGGMSLAAHVVLETIHQDPL